MEELLKKSLADNSQEIPKILKKSLKILLNEGIPGRIPEGTFEVTSISRIPVKMKKYSLMDVERNIRKNP